jgi:biotin carboxylase
MSNIMRKMNTFSDYTIKVVLSDSLAEETKKVVWMLRNEPSNPESGARAVELLREATAVNMRFYFTEPAQRLNVGAVSVKLLVAGTNTVIKLISSVGHRLIKKLSHQQLGHVADFVEEHLLAHHALSCTHSLISS